MSIGATRIGRTVPRSFEGTVRTVWRRACGVEIESSEPSAGQTRYLTLVRADLPMTAASIAVDVAPEFDFAATSVRAGDRAEYADGLLQIARANHGAILRVRTADADVFDGFPSAGAVTPAWSGRASLDAVAAAARSHRARTCGHTPLGAESASAIDARLALLASAVAENDADAAARGAGALIGLGPGSTPAGDDALCGFMLARRLVADCGGEADTAMRRVVRDARGRTPDLSAEHLRLGADGRFGEALVGVADALVEPGSTRIDAMVVRCLAVGASSGADGLLGLAAGFAAAYREGGRHGC